MCLRAILICFIRFVQSDSQMKENQGGLKFGNVYISAAPPNPQFSMKYPPFYGSRPGYDSSFAGYFGKINPLYYLPTYYGYPRLTNGSANEDKIKFEVLTLQSLINVAT